MSAAPRSDAGPRTYSRGDPFISGETVTPGCFACVDCGAVHSVAEGTVTNLPVCPRCHGERWRIEANRSADDGQAGGGRPEREAAQRPEDESE